MNSSNLSFEFMERTTYIALVKHTADYIYRLKSYMVLFFIFFVHLYTSLLFINNFIVYMVVSLIVMVSISSEKKQIYHKWEQIFFLLLNYMCFPFYTNLSIYLLSAFILIILMEYIFQVRNGYFIHPVLLTLLIIASCFPSLFQSANMVAVLSPYMESFGTFFYGLSLDLGSFYYKQLFIVLLGLEPYAPSMFGLLLGIILAYCFVFIPSYIYRTSLLYVLLVTLFAYIYVLVHNILVFEEAISYFTFFCKILLELPVFFIGLFFIPESLGSASANKQVLWFTFFSSFMTVVFFIIGIGMLSPFMALLFSHITYYFYDFKKIFCLKREHASLF